MSDLIDWLIVVVVNVFFTCSVHSTDRRSVNFTTHVPRRQLQLNGETIVVRATNNYEKLRLCLTFPKPVNNTSEEIKKFLKAEVLYSLQKSQGSLLPLVDTKQYQGPSRFEYKVRWFSQSNFIFSDMRVEVGSQVRSLFSCPMNLEWLIYILSYVMHNIILNWVT